MKVGHNAMKSNNPDLEPALALLRGLKVIQTSALASVHAQANAASAAGNNKLDLALTREAIRLSQQNLAIANAERKAKLGHSLAAPVQKLKALTQEADAALGRLHKLSDALDAARQVVDILRRLVGIFN
jgi:hypothetical protein